MSVLSEPTIDFLNNGLGVWNKGAEKVWELLSIDPTKVGETVTNTGGVIESQGTPVWSFMANTVQPIMVGLGTALVGVFFFWGWIKNSVDVKEDMRLENIIRMLIRLCLAEFLVINNFKIMALFFNSGTALVRALSGPSWTQMEVSSGVRDTIMGYNFFQCLGIMILGCFFFIIIAVLSVMLILSVVNRFLKIFIAIPLGTVAFSTFAGDREIAHSSSSYFKYALALAIEGAAIGLALIAGARIVTSINLFGDSSVFLWMVEKVFEIAAVLGVVKGIQEIINRVFGI